MNNFVSFIVPIYNTEDYLAKCINSIIEQNLKKFEIILIDDESTDKSSEICDDFANKFDNISVFHIKKSGVSFCRNYGIEKSKGDKIIFVDSDDYFEKDSLVNITDWNFDFICFGFNKKYVNKSIPYVDFEPKLNNYNDFLLSIFCNDNIAGYLWNKIFDKKIITKNNIYFNENIGYCEDLLFVDEYIKKAKTFKYYPIIIYNYLQRKKSVSYGKYNDNYLTIFKAYDYIIDNHSNKEEIIIRCKFDYIIRALKMHKCITDSIKTKVEQYIKKDHIIDKVSYKNKSYYLLVKYFLTGYNLLREFKHLRYKLYN